MCTLKQWIEEEAKGEPVIGLVFGEMGWGDYNSNNVPNYRDQPKGKLLSWDEALPWLQYKFDSGFGAPGCNAVFVWTKSKVMFISTYDGATSIHSIPRKPTNCMPYMSGGG